MRDEVDQIVASALTEEPTVVIGHSLGSVVAYNILRTDRRTLRVPLYVTVGCPLGIRAIRDQFRPLKFPLPVKAWYNAFDTRDVVALYPLDQSNFPVTPPIENNSMVKNQTDNRHGIIGYLDNGQWPSGSPTLWKFGQLEASTYPDWRWKKPRHRPGDETSTEAAAPRAQHLRELSEALPRHARTDALAGGKLL